MPNFFFFLFKQSVVVCCDIHNVPRQLRGVRRPVCQSSGQPHRAGPEPLGPEQGHSYGCYPPESAVHSEVIRLNACLLRA